MSQTAFAGQHLVHLVAGAGIFLVLGDEGEHDRQRTAIGGAHQRLQLHPHHAGTVQRHPDRAPAKRRVGLVQRFHVGQHLVRPDVERAEDHALALGGVQHLGVDIDQFGAFGHLVADEELQLCPEQAHPFGAGAGQRGQVGHETGVHVQVHAHPVGRNAVCVADRGIAFLRLGLHGHLVAKGADHGFVRAQVHDALVAVDQDLVAVQRLVGDAVDMDHQRDRQGAGDDGGMAADRAFLQHHALELAVVFQQFAGADVAGDQDRVFGQFGASLGALAGEDAQQPVRQVVEIVQPVAQVGVVDLRHAGAGRGLFLFHRRLGREATGDVLFHAAHPALGIGEHAVGFQHLGVFALASGAGQHLVDRDAQLVHRIVQALQFAVRVVGHRVGDDDAGFVQPGIAHGAAFLPGAAPEQQRLGVARLERRALADEGAQFGHLGQDHRHHFERVDLVRGEFAGLLGLDDQHPQLGAEPLDRHAEEAGIDLFAGFGHVAEPAGRGSIRGIDRLAGGGDAAHQALAQFHPGLVHGLFLEALGGTEFQRFTVAEEVDRADLCPDAVGRQVGDLVQARLSGGILGHRVAKPAKKLAAFRFGICRHGCLPAPLRWMRSGAIEHCVPHWKPLFTDVVRIFPLYVWCGGPD